MKPLNKKQKTLLTIGISSSIIIIFIAFFIYPETSDILDLNNKIYKEKIRQEELSIKEQDLKQAKDKEKDIDLILNQFSVHLTTSENILNFIIQLENIAKQTNNTQEISILEEQNAPKAKKTENEEKPENVNSTNTLINQSQTLAENDFINVEVKLLGTFDNLIDYLEELRKASILTDEESINSQLSELSELPTNQPIAENLEPPKSSDISTALKLKVYIKNTNATK